ncbi:uncharacterized protein LOC131532373 isoform X1 [Onychostoma macrolepis]|uniref:uncharacterized protein LOC131532373 isoform X1 n=1 Tax=Onychostoma macrolepis TaxID=369639 RepID=UPI00272ACFE4|nr:uncharacterized protein LOC131532373 isoform X1 [Onychostoma macrolepis]
MKCTCSITNPVSINAPCCAMDCGMDLCQKKGVWSKVSLVLCHRWKISDTTQSVLPMHQTLARDQTAPLQIHTVCIFKTRSLLFSLYSSLFLSYSEVTIATQIQSVSRSDGGSAPRDDLDSPECQRRPGHLDEPQRQIPSEDLVGTRPQEPDKSSAQSDLCCSLELNHTMLVSSVQRRTAPKLCLVAPKVLSPMKFWVLAAVAFGLLIWGRLADCKDIIGRELNWMMSTLNHQ